MARRAAHDDHRGHDRDPADDHRARARALSRPKRDIVGAAIVALAAVIRVADIGRRSLWYDEAWLAVGILDGRWEVTPGSLTPVFDALVRASVAVFGRTEVGVRAERRPGDATWVARDARFAFRFYVLDPDPRVEFEVVVGNAAALRGSLAALAAQGEGRVWAIFSHDALADEVRVIGALGRLRIERRITATGAGALLLVAPGDHS